ncbi:Ids2p KNAG_0C02560 [Huiozyma naganishii CBS 8797]|uniref:Uncharacterized protein n=1 Tax=Huiozyma naganishii (strain ATCC MYA-139 / BCRC 22969 / CBS 8797 / KCTC 17520 / NBRC 10181 / NCYC 3082 / Yp74L-3) TaxID=1071383 RepID=J7RWI3_HUIN7|nr:hypothetical protein KNAG_0C02560 [Kazachstania naganishii CBS 8797]CCK69367.1 hypothetical protein KNAG_0C02560 [Kazachstania naganishii CBS 8797]
MDPNSIGEDELPPELADAVRKSWSEQQNMTRFPEQSVHTGNSPIGTPGELSQFEKSEDMDIPTGTATPLNNASSTVQDSLRLLHFREPDAQDEPDYQLFKHHYHISKDTRESVSDILNDLDLGSADQGPLSHSDDLPPIPHQQPQQPQSLPYPMERTPSSGTGITTRRSSIQDVQWIRQLLNPRSSFSGSSANEPAAVEMAEKGAIKCWVTALMNDSPEAVKSMIVLYQSLKATNSKYRLYVLYDGTVDISQLTKFDIHTVPLDCEFFFNGATNVPSSKCEMLRNKKWFILSLFVSFINTNYELICYISPSCMVVENIDELLENQEINNEIDNETCVLLSNANTNNEPPQVIILKPNNEVAMCLREFFTLYGTDDEKIKKLLTLNDYDILRELFGETWAQISSDGYVVVLNGTQRSMNYADFVQCSNGNVIAKIIDYKNVKPWNLKGLQEETTTIAGKWYEVWLNFWNEHK